MARAHLGDSPIDGIDRYWRTANYLSLAESAGARQLSALCDEMLARHPRYIREALDDMPEARDWTWSDVGG
jgi:phosphoketolase